MNYLGLSNTNTFNGDVLMNNNLTVGGNEQVNGNLTVNGTITGPVVSDPVITNAIKTLTPGGALSIKNQAGVTHSTFADNGLFSVNTMSGYSNSLLLADNLGNTQMQLNNGSGSVTAGVRILNGSKLNVDQIESQSYETANNPTINLTNTSINVVNVPLQSSLINTTSVKAINASGIAFKNSSATTSAQVNNDASFQIGPYKMPLTAGSNTNILQTDGNTQASWVPLVNGISNVVQETQLFNMSPTDPLSDFLYYQSSSGATDNNFFQNYPVAQIQAYSSAVTDNYTYSFNEGSTNYLVFAAAPGSFNQNPGTRVIPTVLAGQTSSPNIAHMVKVLSIPDPDIYTKFSLKLSINSCWNNPSSLAIYAVYSDIPPTPVYGTTYVNTCTAVGQYCDILMNDQPFGNILRTQQYDAFTSIRPMNYDFEYPLNTSGINVFQAVSIVISLNYANNGNTNPATLITPTAAGVISTNYTQNYGMEITRMSINAYAISNGTGTLTTNHDLLANLGTESHTAYLTISGDRPMAGNLPMGGNKIINLLDPTSAQDGASKFYVDAQILTAPFLPLAGGTMSGAINMNSNNIIGLTDIRSATATNLGLYHTNSLIANVTATGITMSGSLNMNTNAISNATTINATTFTGALTGHASLDLALTGGTLTGTLNSRAITPTAANTYSLGTSSAYYNNVYAAQINNTTIGTTLFISNATDGAEVFGNFVLNSPSYALSTSQTVTSLQTANTWKLLGTSATAVIASNFTLTGGTGVWTYNGTRTRVFKIDANLSGSLSAGTGADVTLMISKNANLTPGTLNRCICTSTGVGNDIQLNLNDMLVLATNDTIQIALLCSATRTLTIPFSSIRISQEYN